MIIAIALVKNDIKDSVAQSFGRATYFGLYDSSSNGIAYIENTAIAHHGGAGISASQLIIDKNASILIVPRCGENAYQVLHNANIEIFESSYDTGMENIIAFQEGKLAKLHVSSAGAYKIGR